MMHYTFYLKGAYFSVDATTFQAALKAAHVTPDSDALCVSVKAA